MNRKLRSFITFIFSSSLLILLSVSCGQAKRQDTADKDSISEMEQIKYDHALEQLEDIYTDAAEAVHTGNRYKEASVRQEIRVLKYTYDGKNMGVNAKKKCQELKNRIEALKENPELAFQNSKGPLDLDSDNKENKGTLLSRKNMKIYGLQRFPYCLNADDIVCLKLKTQSSIKISFYDIDKKKCIRQWNPNSSLTDSILILKKGIYMLEIIPTGKEAYIDITLTYSGTDPAHRRHVQERIIECSQGEFLSTKTDSISFINIFAEPKKIGLRGNLKTMFSGKSRAVVPIQVPSGCDVLLYSLRVSTNEKTVVSDGNFANQLTSFSKRIKVMGVNVYEKQTPTTGRIDRLLFNTRPVRDDDAFCNMYVFTSSTQAKKFQDETASSGNYKYDVDQSQMGTQSCNGQIKTNGNKTIYLGFENERMRYDNFIWLEVVALKFSQKYVRPVYLAR